MNDEIGSFLKINSDLFFKEAIDKALASQQPDLSSEAAFYLLEVLTGGLRYDPDPKQREAENKPMIVRYKEVYEVSSADINHAHLARIKRASEFRALGDSALVIAGMWWPSLIRKLVDVDYYIAIGSCAYRSVSKEDPELYGGVFEELADKFCDIVNILTEATRCVSIPETNFTDRDILRIYEIYLRTHNPFFRKILSDLKINVVPGTTRIQ